MQYMRTDSASIALARRRCFLCSASARALARLRLIMQHSMVPPAVAAVPPLVSDDAAVCVTSRHPRSVIANEVPTRVKPDRMAHAPQRPARPLLAPARWAGRSSGRLSHSLLHTRLDEAANRGHLSFAAPLMAVSYT